MSFPGLIAFPSREVMAARLADLAQATLEAGLSARGRAYLALSGGSTPAAFYAALSARPLDWERAEISLVDERWVAPGEDGSNETFVREAMMQGPAAAARFVGLYSGAPDVGAGAETANARLAGREGPYDLVLLGMGEDGHTASWFPHAEGLDAALDPENADRAVAVRARKSAVTGDRLDRVTQTFSALADARLLVLLLTGDKKRAAYERACADGSVADMPVRAVLGAIENLWVCWAP